MRDTKDSSDGARGSIQPAERLRAERFRCRTWGGLAVIAAAAIGVAACGGGSSHSPRVASLGTSTTAGDGRGGASPTTAPKGGNATHLMDEWASCMRANGDPNQTDPTIDQYGVINITMPSGVAEEISSEAHGTAGPCSQYELAAENALRAANPVAPPPTQAQLVQYVDCMRTHGVPNYPNSGPNGETDFNGTGIAPTARLSRMPTRFAASRSMRRHGGSPAPGHRATFRCQAAESVPMAPLRASLRGRAAMGFQIDPTRVGRGDPRRIK